MQTKHLLIDIGNSRIKWGLGLDEHIEILKPFTLAQFPEILQFQQIEMPLSIWLSNVTGSKVQAIFDHWAHSRWAMQVHCVTACKTAFGVTNSYEQPESLGVDRWVCMIAARHYTDGPVCIADCGTALTFDSLDAEGKHLGGLIAPGLSLMRKSLIQGAHSLNNSEGDYSDFFAHNTASAISGGTLQAMTGLIERGWNETRSQLDCEPVLILTGGDAERISPQLKIPHQTMADLALQGLLVIAGSHA